MVGVGGEEDWVLGCEVVIDESCRPLVLPGALRFGLCNRWVTGVKEPWIVLVGVNSHGLVMVLVARPVLG